MISPSPEYKKYQICTPINRNYKQGAFDTTNEQNFIASLSDIAQQILISFRNERDQYQKKMNHKQNEYISNAEQQQKIIVELTKRNEELSSENNEMRLKLSQTLRHLKQSEMKIQLLNNKIRLLSHEIAEKEAVIKYLQNKNQDKQHYQPKKMIESTLNNISLSMDESLSSFRNRDISFAKLKETKMKFQDFANTSNQFVKQPIEMSSFKNKTKRIRTESSYEVKQNKNQDNISYKSKNALNQILSHKFWTNSNDKTMAKNMRHNHSTWILQSSKQRIDPSNQRKSINFHSPTYFYTRAEHSYLPTDLSLNVKHSLN